MADIGKLVPVILFSFFMIFTLKDIFVSQSTADANKDIPPTNLGAHKFVAHTLKIFYCYSCGYKNAFEQYNEMLHKKFPEIVVEGGNYPPTGVNAWLARILTIMKMVLIFGVVTQSSVGLRFGNPIRSWWSWCLNNRIYASFMIFLLCNMFEGQLVSTGAFEISFNDVPVWSKLETGRIPHPEELFQIIENQLQFDRHERTVEGNPGVSY